MKSLKIKLLSTISMFAIALAMLIIGVWAVGETQTITMNGSVNFEIADKSLYVKDVRMQEDVNSAPYSLKEQGRFMPGFINGNFDMNLGDFTNSYGSFALYFDIINTMDETTSETFAYTVDQPTAPSGTTVSVSILDTDGITLEQIPQGTVKPSEISDSTLVTATIKLTIASTSSSSVDLSEITIVINQVPPLNVNVLSNNATYGSVSGGGIVQNNNPTTINATLNNNSLFLGWRKDAIDGELVSIEPSYTFTVTEETAGIYYAIFEDLSSSAFSFEYDVLSEGKAEISDYDGNLTQLIIPGYIKSSSGEEYIVTSIQNVFHASNVESVIFPSTLENLGVECELTGPTAAPTGDGAFEDCVNITTIDLTHCTNLTILQDHAFFGCTALESVYLPSNLSTIAECAFGECTSLKTIDFGENSQLKVLQGAFYNCTSLENIVIPKSVESIEGGVYNFHMSNSRYEGTFTGCTNLKNIVFEDGSQLYNVGTLSYYNSTYDFQNCDSLEYNYDDEGNMYIGTESNDYFLLVGLGNSSATEVTVNNACEVIAGYVFRNTNITTVNIPTNLRGLSNAAFSNIDTLVSIDLSSCSNLEYINDYAFYSCGELSSVIFPSNLTNLSYIGDRAFYNCSKLSLQLNLSDCINLSYIGDYAFHDIGGFTGELDFSLCKIISYIGANAFYGCSGLTGELDFSNNTTLSDIGANAFYGCSGLTGELDLSNCTNLTSIGSNAFRECSGLTNANLSGCTSLTSIGSNAFSGCSALKSVTFPSTTGWYVTNSWNATSGTNVSVTNPSTNASNLTGQYRTYYWKRNA